jgi:hypothetical protein
MNLIAFVLVASLFMILTFLLISILSESRKVEKRIEKRMPWL